MKNRKTLVITDQMLQSTKIEMFHSLSEKFGTKYGSMEIQASEQDKFIFKLDRFFSIVHHN